MQTFQSLFLFFLGSMDCLTTVIGTLYFGTVELNPLIPGLVNTNLAAFVKLTVTFSVGLIFIFAEKTLSKSANKDSRSFKIAHKLLRIAYFGIVLFLAIVVANNILVLFKIVG